MIDIGAIPVQRLIILEFKRLIINDYKIGRKGFSVCQLSLEYLKIVLCRICQCRCRNQFKTYFIVVLKCGCYFIDLYFQLLICAILKPRQVLYLNPRRKNFPERFCVYRISAIKFSLYNKDCTRLVVDINSIDLLVPCTVCDTVFCLVGIKVMNITKIPRNKALTVIGKVLFIIGLIDV